MEQAVSPIAVRPWTPNGISERLVASHDGNGDGGAGRTLDATWRDATPDAGAPGRRTRALERQALLAMPGARAPREA
jgi:hypothetical protein